MKEIVFRQATNRDLVGISALVAETRSYFKAVGIPQWQGPYPAIGDFEIDIARGECYLALNRSGEVVGMMVVSTEAEPSYDLIFSGKWHYQEQATVVHRLAVSHKARGQGIAKNLLKLAEVVTLEQGRHVIRVDTHELNVGMEGLLKSCDFSYAGIIYVVDGTPRRAFDKHIVK